MGSIIPFLSSGFQIPTLYNVSTGPGFGPLDQVSRDPIPNLLTAHGGLSTVPEKIHCLLFHYIKYVLLKCYYRIFLLCVLLIVFFMFRGPKKHLRKIKLKSLFLFIYLL